MFWIEWNRMAEGMADLTYRIEDLCPDLVRIMLEKIGEFRSLREIVGAMEVPAGGRNSHVDEDTPQLDCEAVRNLPFYSELEEAASHYRYPPCE